jgi:regulator of RNase E activity RraA
MRLVQLKRRSSTDSTITDGQVIYQDTRGIIRIRKSKKERQNNGQKIQNKSTNNALQKIHIKLMIESHEPH